MARICFLIALFFTGSLALKQQPFFSEFLTQLPNSGITLGDPKVRPSLQFTTDTTNYTAGSNYTEKCTISGFPVKSSIFVVSFGLKGGKHTFLDARPRPRDQELGVYVVNGSLNQTTWIHSETHFSYGNVKNGTVSESGSEFTGLVRLTQDLPKGGRLFCLLGWFDGTKAHFVKSNPISI